MLARLAWVLIVLGSPLWVDADGLDAAAQRGRQIYLQGTSARGTDIVAAMGPGGVEVPAATLPCVNCHGHDGRGRPEGGVTPSNLTWAALTKPYGVRHPSGRTHPPYTEQHLVRAIAMGIDAGGQALHEVMPRYQLSREDAADLVAYIKQLGMARDPGLAEDVVRIGIMLPPAKRYPEMHQAVRALLTAYAAQRNAEGGIYSRRLRLQFAESPASPAARPEALRHFLTSQPSFVLTSVFMAGAERDMADLIQAHSIPAIGTFTTDPQVDFPLNRYVFYLYSGLSGQAQSLAVFAHDRQAGSNRRAAVVYPDEPRRRDIAEALLRRCRAAGWEAIDSIPVPPTGIAASDLAQNLQQRGTEMVFWLAAGADARLLLREAESRGWQPELFIRGSGGGSSTCRLMTGTSLWLSTSPADHTPAGCGVSPAGSRSSTTSNAFIRPAQGACGDAAARQSAHACRSRSQPPKGYRCAGKSLSISHWLNPCHDLRPRSPRRGVRGLHRRP